MARDATWRSIIRPVLCIMAMGLVASSCWTSGPSRPETAPERPAPAPLRDEPDGFVGLTPARVLDTRPGEATIDGAYAGGGAAAPDQVVALGVLRRGGVAAEAVAVVLNVTATGAAGGGYVTAWPCGAPRPWASNLNFGRGATVPNLVVVKVGTGGAVCLASAGAAVHLIADVAGYFTAGGFDGLVPARLLDTRPSAATVDAQGGGGGPRRPGAITRLEVSGRAGIAVDAAGVVLNVTATDAEGPGYVTVWPCDRPQPLASNLNYSAAGPRPNLVLQGLTPGDAVCLVTAGAPVNLIADVAGYVPAGSPLAGLEPARVLDTRPGGATVDGAYSGGSRSAAGGLTELRVGGRAGVGTTATAVVLNITATESAGPGYLTAWPCGEPRPLASNLNYGVDDTVPNLAVVKVGVGGSVCLYTAGAPVQLIVDVAGQLLPTATPPPLGVGGAWRLAFADEFDGTAIDEAKWSPCYPHGNWYGCSSGELQWYLPEQVRTSGGAVQLVAEAVPFQIDHNPPRFASHRSGMLSTLRLHDGEPNKFTFRYGFVEFRATLPRGTGLFPALWLASGAGNSEEIDVVENLGHDTTTLYQTVHWPMGGTSGGDLKPYRDAPGTDYADGMHTYGLDWEPDHVAWYIDGQLARATFVDQAKIPAGDMGVIMDLAIGGSWACGSVPVPCPAPTAFPAVLAIDYVRVWQRR